MPSAPFPPDEAGRLAALHALDLLDTPPDNRFEVFTRLACEMLDAPIAAVSLVDAERLWFKSARGLPAPEVPREGAFCACAILAPDRTFVVPDAAHDPRFRDHPAVAGDPGVRFYVGVPLLAGPDGHPVGTLCVMDHEPRPAPSPEATARLEELARAVEGVIELHRTLQTLGDLATRDPLTGLANRRGFEARLGRAAGFPLALLCLDLDGFKSINDLYGHAGGDAALAEVARRLTAVVRPGDLVARLGGDEFAVLCDRAEGGSAAAEIASRIHRALVEPFSLEGQPVPLRTSIGIARSPADARDPEGLLRAADAALYRAKRRGRGTTCAYGDMDIGDADRAGGGPGWSRAAPPAAAAAAAAAPPPGRREIEADLRAALLPERAAGADDGTTSVRVVWQPVCDARTRRPVALEALCRWARPGSAVLSPVDFVPVAEATGLVAHLDRRVLRAACREAAGWPSPLPVCVNLSAASLFRLDLLEVVEGALAEAGLSPTRLTLEVTETGLVQDARRAREALDALRRLGARVALDDFGAGHGSLSYLRDLAFDAVKIDRSFVADLRTGPRAEAVVRGVVALARHLGLDIVAEGVETEAELAFLREEGVDAVQGFLLGRPGPAEAVLATGLGALRAG